MSIMFMPPLPKQSPAVIHCPRPQEAWPLFTASHMQLHSSSSLPHQDVIVVLEECAGMETLHDLSLLRASWGSLG